MMTAAELAQRLQALLQDLLDANPEVPGAVLEVAASSLDFAFSTAAGRTRLNGGEALRPEHPLRLASNTKTFVAAAILRLHEEGRLAIDDAIARYLPDAHCRVLREGGYDPEAITVRHLLTHTSGLFDYSDSAVFVEAVLAGGKRWTRLEQLEGAMAWGRPYGAPGEVYRYSDSGYIELGEILEQVTGLPNYGAAMRSLLDFERLGLAATWVETLEPWPAGVPPRAEQYLDGRSNADFDVSTDLYGGGGMIAALGDLRRFFAALFQGQVFRRSETLALMLTSGPALRGGPAAYGFEQRPGEYRMGLMEKRLAGLEAFVHSGYFGTQAAWIPDLDAVVALGVNIAETDLDADLLQAVAALLLAAKVTV